MHAVGRQERGEGEEESSAEGHLVRGVLRNVPKCTKLKIAVMVEFEDGSVKEMQALIDTGAEINVIHPKHVPPETFVASKRPLRLGMVNAICLQGDAER